VAALEAQKAISYSQGGAVFINPRTGKAWETDAQIRKTAWIPALRRARLPYRTAYQTRHTFASLMLSAGENPMWVAQQMGHRDWGMIRKVYGKWISEVDPFAGDRAAKLWSQPGHRDKASA
jgi:integrase